MKKIFTAIKQWRKARWLTVAEVEHEVQRRLANERRLLANAWSQVSEERQMIQNKLGMLSRIKAVDSRHIDTVHVDCDISRIVLSEPTFEADLKTFIAAKLVAEMLALNSSGRRMPIQVDGTGRFQG